MRKVIGGILIGMALSTDVGKKALGTGGKLAVGIGNTYLKSKGIDVSNYLQIGNLIGEMSNGKQQNEQSRGNKPTSEIV